MFLKLLRFASILFILTLSASNLKSQMGINFRVHTNNFEVWNEVIKNADNRIAADIFNRSFQIGIDYGFDLPMYRVSFFPEISYGWSESQIESDFFSSELYTVDFILERYSFNFKTFIYPLDLLSKQGMNCPSFYRGADKFIKGWYILVFPELAYSKKSGLLSSYLLEAPFEDESFVFNFGIGSGLDIGITSNFSISPHFMYGFSVGEKWEGFSNTSFNQPSYNDGTNASYLTAGIRLGFWFN